ncbi:hypothetical protein HHI36_023605 [Cryptolaemus montrouzieri]|uniref:Uncharacterized protein n=1 Tax=Cryptolaemus montrouzieri TaxID=559131 RepID=A0ABD2PJ15_9CUCU
MNEAILLIRSKWQQIRKKLITFEELNIGNRICACGDISFYKDNFYMFVDNLRRYEGVEGNIIFMKKVFHLTQNCESFPTQPCEGPLTDSFGLNFEEIDQLEKGFLRKENSSATSTVPLEVDEELYCQKEQDNEKDNEDPKDWITAPLPFNDDDFIERDNINIVTLFINHILNSAKESTFFRFRNISFRKAIIFGIIVGKCRSSKEKNITVDDGTGQLTCLLQNANEYLQCTENPAGQSEEQINKDIEIIRSKLHKIRKDSVRFEELNIGDRVCASGDIKFHEDNFYMFINNLQRHERIEDNIIFMKKVFHLTQNYENTPTQPCEGSITKSYEELNFEGIGKEKEFFQRKNSCATSTPSKS